MVEYLINCKKKDGITPFINVCNAQTELDHKVKEICNGKYEILTKMTDRAGNLEDGDLLGKRNEYGKIQCSLCGSLFNRNVLLPDGTIVLCCMDFGLTHVLGNLLKNSYEQLVNGAEIAKIKRGCEAQEDYNILCRKCSYGSVYQ